MRIAVGSYASKEQSGIQIVEYDATTHRISSLSEIAGIERPSFIGIHPTRPYLFVVSELAEGQVVSYLYHEETAELTELSRQSTAGTDPCYIQAHESGRWILGTNYTSGSVFVHPVSDDGVIGPMSQLITHQGRSVREDRQTCPHPHSIWNLPNTRYWIVPDLGTDNLYIYVFDESVGQLTLHNQIATTTGAGPRHIAFHPTLNVFYVVQELSSSIAAFSYDAFSGVMERMQTDVSILPSGIDTDGNVDNTAADIHVSFDGSQVYASNRGYDSVAMLTLQSDGRIVPSSLVAIPSGGHTPRNFAVVASGQGGPTALLVANQDSDNIVILGELDADNNRKRLQQVGDPVPAIKPVCLKVISEIPE